jgi:hypothetical protein
MTYLLCATIGRAGATAGRCGGDRGLVGFIPAFFGAGFRRLAGNKAPAPAVSASGHSSEDEMSYDPGLRVPSIGRDIAGLILWALLVAGLCLEAPPTAALRLASLGLAPLCAGAARPMGS